MLTLDSMKQMFVLFAPETIKTLTKEENKPKTCYRPQRSWGKVIFSEACVHGGGVCPIACWDTHAPPRTRGRHPRDQRHTPLPLTRGTHPQDQRQTPTPWSRPPPPPQLHVGRHSQKAGGTHPTGMFFYMYCPLSPSSFPLNQPFVDSISSIWQNK